SWRRHHWRAARGCAVWVADAERSPGAADPNAAGHLLTEPLVGRPAPPDCGAAQMRRLLESRLDGLHRSVSFRHACVSRCAAPRSLASEATHAWTRSTGPDPGPAGPVD